MPLIPKTTCQLIFDSGNDYAALKGNQPSLLKDVKKTLHRNLRTDKQRAWSN